MAKSWDEKLITAAQSGNLYGVTEALHRGADVNACNSSKETALIWAAYNGHRDVVEELITAGARLDDRDNSGDTALKACNRQRHYDCGWLLIKAGANIQNLDPKHHQIYADALNERYLQNPYSRINDDTVVKYQGHIENLGTLRHVFNFKTRTVTEVINENPGPANSFEQFRNNQDDILEAYDWVTKQGGTTPAHPFKKGRRQIQKRS